MGGKKKKILKSAFVQHSGLLLLKEFAQFVQHPEQMFCRSSSLFTPQKGFCLFFFYKLHIFLILAGPNQTTEVTLRVITITSGLRQPQRVWLHERVH